MGSLIGGLILLLLLILFLPFTVPIIERNLEVFLFLCSLIAVYLSGIYSEQLFLHAVKSPIGISLAVLFFGLLFNLCHPIFESVIHFFSKRMPIRFFLATLVIILGLLSSIITAIIAALALISIVQSLRMDRPSEIKFVILACFSIGLGAVLTPIGEPLSTIATHKLNEEFTFLFTLLSPSILPGLLFFGLMTVLLIKPTKALVEHRAVYENESLYDISLRSFKIYLFVMALTLLGASFEPFITLYLIDLHPFLLYWMNIISAILDNATLASAEISPAMDHQTIRAILLGLLVSGGMLIPGSIPNIIAAGKLNISSKEWARFGIPFGLLMMILYFLYILLAYQFQI